MKNFWLNSSLHLWEVDDGEQHWYSAYSKKDVLNQYLESFDLCQDEIEEIEVSLIPDDFMLPVFQDDGDQIIKTAKQWCEDGRGLIASTCY